MAPDASQRLHARIRGRVQGVFFRAWTRETARKLKLQGWVRNCPDGSVELAAEGPLPRLEEFLKRCWEGPPAAQVEDIQLEWRDAEGAWLDFEIHH